MSLRPALHRMRKALTRRYIFTPLYDGKRAFHLIDTLPDPKLRQKAARSFDFWEQAKIIAPVICSEKRMVQIQDRIHHHYLKLRINSIN